MTDRELMQQALDALIEVTGWQWAGPMRVMDEVEDAINALRQAIAEAEKQEPVMDWTPCIKLPVVVHVRKQRPGETHVSTREGITPVKPDDLIMRGVSGEEYPIGRDIFEQTYSLETSTPASKPWVGLTDEELIDLTAIYSGAPLYCAIESKLKEKNT